MTWTEAAPMKERMRFVTDWERDLRLNEIGMIKSSPQKIVA